MLTLLDVKTDLNLLRELSGDDEAAHSFEDSLFITVLTAIANGAAENPQEMARLALTAQDVIFARWYA